MKRLSLLTVLFIPLGYLFVAQLDNYFEISGYYYPIPFQSSAFIAILVIGAAVLLATDILKRDAHHLHAIRAIVVASTIVVFVTTAVFAQILIRHKSGYFGMAHDGAQLTEVAGSFLLDGKNPYAENYQHTLFGQYNAYNDQPGRDNPAWHYYVYLPFYLVTSTAAQWLSNMSLGWFDDRFVLLAMFIITLLVLYRLVPDSEQKLVAVFLFAFNPFFTQFFITGYNDIFVFTLIIASLYLLHRRHVLWSAAIFGLALASKQSAWPLAPLYLMLVYWLQSGTMTWRPRLVQALRKVWPAVLTFGVFVIPFVIWSPADFISDTISYAGGAATYNYPISGVGISNTLLEAGIIKDAFDTYPFWLLQVIVCLPLLYFLFRWLRRDRTISTLLLAYALFLLFFWYLSRFFNANYLSFISLIIIAAWAFNQAETKSIHE